MKIAVIGSGISGNVAAHKLSHDHDITLFEARDSVGGHTQTHHIEYRGRNYSVDTGFIVFNRKTYPNFVQLLDQLNVPYQTTEMSFSVKSELTGLEYNGNTLNSLFAQRRNLLNPAFYRMITDILRFNRRAPVDLVDGNLNRSLGDYLTDSGYSRQFIDHYIIPMGAAIWSTDIRQIMHFPAHFFVRFFYNHGLLTVNARPQWYVIKNGSARYLKPLLDSGRIAIRLSSPVSQIRRLPGHIEIKVQGKPWERFDAVFIASHSDQALAMLDDPSEAERTVLGSIRYQQNEAVLHTDASVLPKRRLAWAAWNYHLLAEPGQGVALTYNMNILQGHQAPAQFCVTLNHSEAINPRKIIKRVRYEHPVFTLDSMNAQQRHRELNGFNRTYYCGAYWRNGFHEDGVVSALHAVQHFNEDSHEQLHLRRAG